MSGIMSLTATPLITSKLPVRENQSHQVCTGRFAKAFSAWARRATRGILPARSWEAALATPTQFHRARWMDIGDSPAQLLHFMSTCPRCRRRQAQCGFSRAALLRLLDDDLEILAYCASCNDFWPISDEERREVIGEFDG